MCCVECVLFPAVGPYWVLSAARCPVTLYPTLSPCSAAPAQDGDPYKEEMEQCVAMIMARLRERGVPNHHSLAYQSGVGRVRRRPGPQAPAALPAPAVPWAAASRRAPLQRGATRRPAQRLTLNLS